MDRRQREALARAGDNDFEKIHLFPNSHAAYYPGARPIAMKVIFRKSDGRLLGASLRRGWRGQTDQHARHGDPDARDRSTTSRKPSCATRRKFGSAKDPVNFAGMIAANVLRGDMPIRHWDDVGDEFLLDVRAPDGARGGKVPGALNIPLGQLRSRLASFHAIARFSSSAVPAPARTTRPGSCCRTGSTQKRRRRHALAQPTDGVPNGSIAAFTRDTRCRR
jgi:hypothetical protein